MDFKAFCKKLDIPPALGKMLLKDLAKQPWEEVKPVAKDFKGGNDIRSINALLAPVQQGILTPLYFSRSYQDYNILVELSKSPSAQADTEDWVGNLNRLWVVGSLLIFYSISQEEDSSNPINILVTEYNKPIL